MRRVDGDKRSRWSSRIRQALSSTIGRVTSQDVLKCHRVKKSTNYKFERLKPLLQANHNRILISKSIFKI